MKGFKVKVKSRRVMKDYRCLHGLLKNNELPVKLRGRIPKNEIWIRKDQYNQTNVRQLVLRHERNELHLMKDKKMKYKPAHRRAQITEHTWWLTDKKRDFRRYLRKNLK
jgi:hypothetical protein